MSSVSDSSRIVDVITEARIRLINGGSLDEDTVSSMDVWAAPRFRLSVFLSSTFTDTHRERAVLMEKVLPRLREKAKPHNVDVTFVDMRWGVQDENTLEHLKWDACKREIHRCYNES